MIYKLDAKLPRGQVGKNIAYIRKLKNITRKAMSKETGITSCMLKKYELGLSKVTIEQMEKIALYLGISEAKLCGYDCNLKQDEDIVIYLYSQLPNEEKSKVIMNITAKLNELRIPFDKIPVF